MLLLWGALGAAEKEQGEYAYLNDGSPAMIGQTMNDHLFVRNTYNETGVEADCDNFVSFKTGPTQTVWFWLDDDGIYDNEMVQALTPEPYNSSGDLYNEITYNSCQFNIYLPKTLRLIEVNEDDMMFVGGNRLPSSTNVYWAKQTRTKTVDGIEYNVYVVTVTNQQSYGSHFSARNPSMYRQRGALRKNDAPLFALMLINDNQSQAQGRIDDMIIANQEFGIWEAIIAGWSANDYRFIYGKGGNNVQQRFQYYTRVNVYGSLGFTAVPGDADNDGQVSISDVTTLINGLLRGNIDATTNPGMDVDSDGKISIEDVTALINLLLQRH